MSDNHLNEQGIYAHLSADKWTGVLAFHGRNSGPESMEKLIHDLGWDDASAYALPRAANKTWYPEKFMAPLEKNKAQLDLALESAKKHHQMLREAGLNDDQIIIMGFSQGACLAAHYALLNPALYRGVAVLTGGYVGHEGIDWKFEGDFKDTPVFLTTSEIDEWVPPSRAKETVREFEKLGAKVTFKLFKDRPHTISEEEKEMLRRLITVR